MLLVLISDTGVERYEPIQEIKPCPSLEITIKCPSGIEMPVLIKPNAPGKLLFDKVKKSDWHTR